MDDDGSIARAGEETGAAPPAEGSEGPRPPAAPGQPYAVARRATPVVVTDSGERVEVTHEAIEAAVRGGAPGGRVELATAGGARLSIQVPGAGGPGVRRRQPGSAGPEPPPAPLTEGSLSPLPPGAQIVLPREPETASAADAPPSPPSTDAPGSAPRPESVSDDVAPSAPSPTTPAARPASGQLLASAIFAAASQAAPPLPTPPAAADPTNFAAPTDGSASTPAPPAADTRAPGTGRASPEPDSHSTGADPAAEAPPVGLPTEGEVTAALAMAGGESQVSIARADAESVQIRSEEIDEILTTMPGGLLRWGSSAVFVTLAVLLGIAWFIRYPDVVQGTVSLTTVSPPVRVVSRTAGEVGRVFVADGAPVRPGDALVLLKTPASYDDVRALTAALDRTEPALQRRGELPAVAFDHTLSLGDLQTQFSSFLQAYSDYRTLLADPYYTQKVAAVQTEMGNLEQLRERLKAQQALLDEQLSLAERSRARSRQLGTQNLSSSAEVDQAEQQYLQQRYAGENGRTAMANNEIQLAAQRASLIDLQQRRADDEQRLLTQLRNAHHSLRAAISLWEQMYLLRTPVAGTVSLFRDLHENQFVSAQEPLVAVLPAAGDVVGRVKLSGVGAGKVRVGQRVIVQLESFPYKEYGTLEGRVSRISQLGFEPQQQGQGSGVTYQADVVLTRGLMTSYNRRLQFTQEMRGVVQVVTDDVSLLQRVFNQVRSLREVN